MNSIDHWSLLIIFSLLVIGGIVSSLIRNYRQTIAQRIKEHSSEVFQQYLIIAESVVETTVIKLSETLVRELKKDSEDGVLTKEEGLHVLNIAIAQIKVILGNQFTELISEFMGDFDKWLEQEIEKYVAINKANYNVSDLYNDLKRAGVLK